MYASYKREETDGATRYLFSEKVSLFGCNEGYIPWLLTKQLKNRPSEPLKWEPPEPVKCYVCNGTGGYEILEEVEWRSRCDCDRYTHACFHDHNDCKLEITYRRRVVTCFMCDGKGAY